jgi:hypothetical protein
MSMIIQKLAAFSDGAQGDDMGMPSRLQVEIPSTPGASIRVSGLARILNE